MDDTSIFDKLNEKVDLLQSELNKKNIEIESLKKDYKHLLEIHEESNIPTFVINKDHVITHYNKALVKLTGIPAEKIIGTQDQWKAFYAHKRPVMADLLIDNATEEDITKLYSDFYKKSKVIPGSYEAEGFFKDLGEDGKWLFFTASPIKNENNEIVGAIETLQDVTDRKRAEENLKRSENRYKSLLGFSPYPIVVYDLKGHVIYANPAFTEIFGWDITEVKGKSIPFFPQGIENDEIPDTNVLQDKNELKRQVTKRLTKKGNVIDVVLRVATLLKNSKEPAGKMVIFRDITNEKRITRNNEAMLRISLALPRYRYLDKLLDFISIEVKRLLDTEGALIILQDEETGELYFPGAAYDDSETIKKVKESRFLLDQLIAGKVIETGEPLIINDMTMEGCSFPERDNKFGYQTRNIIEVPLKGKSNIIGVLAAINKKEGEFQKDDIELLSMVASTIALSIENASYASDLKKAFREVKELNLAKDKAINHLSHELRTPVSTLKGVIELLEHELKNLPEENWKATMDITQRNLDRIVEIQEVVTDIMRGNQGKAYDLLATLFNQCVDVLEVLIESEIKDTKNIEKARKHVEEYFGLREDNFVEIYLDTYVKERIKHAIELAGNRKVTFIESLDSVPSILMPENSIQKIVDGLLKNAIENTPDEGLVEVSVRKIHERVELTVHDHGVGIIHSAQKRIFEGFFTTQDTMYYSTKTPYAFNAGGKGADLLRMKIYSEKYGFEIDMHSTRCIHIPKESDICSGKISECPHIDAPEGCIQNSGSTFTIIF